MYHLHSYLTDSEFQAAYNGSDYNEPWASYTIEEEEVNYNKTEQHDYSLDYLTFRVTSNGVIAWRAYSGCTKTIEYSINGGAWTSITSSSPAATISVSSGDVVRFRGTNSAYGSNRTTYAGFDSASTATFNMEGNVMSLVSGDNFSGTTTLSGSWNFYALFKGTKVVSAENLVLPATGLTEYCYRALFSFCTSLTKAPKLPALTLARGCYWYMFEACAISKAPDLMAAALVNECYGNMFVNCHSLNYIKCMATTNLGAASGLTSWVSGVSATGTFVKEENTAWASGNSGIPTNWYVVNEARSLGAAVPSPSPAPDNDPGGDDTP